MLISHTWLKVDERRFRKYTIGTWSRKATNSEIECHRTPQDITSFLLWEGSARQISPQGMVENPKTKVRRVVPHGRRKQLDPQVVNDLFARTCDDIPVKMKELSFECWDGSFHP